MNFISRSENHASEFPVRILSRMRGEAQGTPFVNLLVRQGGVMAMLNEEQGGPKCT